MDDTPHWFKSSYSRNASVCLETAFDDRAAVDAGRLHVLLRDSVTPSATVLAADPRAWISFVGSARLRGAER